ncbi:hypothetical protein JL720_836 [Aureococcus anophagefferens]|nr:hypothetical protein JL720_836 [Aureococcus anophagefferens]
MRFDRPRAQQPGQPRQDSMRPLCAWICVVAAPATAFLRPQGPPQRRSLRASPGDDWEPREDWALLDNVDAFTRRGAAGPYLFYDELRSTSAALSGRSAGDVRRRLAALDRDCPPDPRTLEDWRAEGESAYVGALDGDATTLVVTRTSVLDGGGLLERRYVETLGGELEPPLASTLAGGAILANALFFAAAFSHAGDARPLAGDSFYVESSTTVTQKLKGDDGQAVTRVQRQRSTRSNSNPQKRVETQTVVKRTAKDDAGNLVVTTTRDRSVNSASRAARPASSAEMAKLLKQGLLAPAAPEAVAVLPALPLSVPELPSADASAR